MGIKHTRGVDDVAYGAEVVVVPNARVLSFKFIFAAHFRDDPFVRVHEAICFRA